MTFETKLDQYLTTPPDEPKRVCDICEQKMTEGYCIDDGREYYCSDHCLHEQYTKEEYLEMYGDGEGTSYWTQWEE